VPTLAKSENLFSVKKKCWRAFASVKDNWIGLFNEINKLLGLFPKLI
jgi:hypothetical protein